MELLMYGMDYKHTSIEIREKFSFSTTQVISITNDLLDLGIPEVLLLSTCNRTEIYLAINRARIDAKKDKIKDYFEKRFNITFDSVFSCQQNKTMVTHLFKVASGLDSLVVGEDQILGQVKDAHELAIELGSSKKLLNKLFRESITTAKQLKTTYKISEKPLSISYIGVEFLEEKIGTFEEKDILLIGLGEMGKLVLKNLLEKNFNKLYMSNRSHDKVVDLKQISDKIIPFDYNNRYEMIAKVDLLITATGSPHTIIKDQHLRDIKKPLTILDLAVPRDVSSQIGKRENCQLYNIDHLKEISQENKQKREKIAQQMMDEIQESVNTFIEWKTTVKADHLIKHLTDEISKIKQDTIEVIENKSNLSSKDRSVIDQMVNSALKRVIRKPILNLKSTTSEEELEKHITTMKKLFEL